MQQLNVEEFAIIFSLSNKKTKFKILIYFKNIFLEFIFPDFWGSSFFRAF